MEKEQMLRKGRYGALSNSGRNRFGVRYWILMLFMALYLTSLGPNTLAESCIQECQRVLTQCVNNAQGDPVMEAQCQDNFDDCVADCMEQ